MQQFELGNFIKNKQQLQQKLASIDRLKDKITQMSNKLTHCGYQRVNSVMLRRVQIKHTSEFMLKLNKEYFAEAKTHTVLQNLQRKRKSNRFIYLLKIDYEEQLKKVDYKIELLTKKIKKAENKERENDFLDKYDKSTVEVIGTNEQGESIFNIIEVEGEGDDDVGEWKEKKKKSIQKDIKKQQKIEEQQQKKQEQKASKVNTKQQTPVPQMANSKQQQQISSYQIQGDQDILFDNCSQQDQSNENELSDIDEDQQEHQQEKIENKIVESKEVKQQKKVQGEKKHHQYGVKQQVRKDNEKQQQVVKKQPETIQIKPLIQKPQKALIQQKQTAIQKSKQPEQTKPISKFKLERMKQKLQQNL